jgi:hypothetical protein
MSAVPLSIMKFELKWAELAALPAAQRTILAMVGFAENEINALRRVTLLAMKTLDGYPELEHAAAIQRNIFLRQLSSKLYEFLEFMKPKDPKKHAKFRNKLDQILTDAFEKFDQEIEELRSLKGNLIAARVRDKLAHHFDFGFVNKSVKESKYDFDSSLFLLEKGGNSYFAIGESVVFGAMVQAESNGAEAIFQVVEDVDKWIDWTLKVSELATRVHLELLDKIIFSNFPDRTATEMRYSVPSDLLADVDQFRMPIFVR